MRKLIGVTSTFGDALRPTPTMLPFDNALFMLINADTGTSATVLALAKWFSLSLPLWLSGAIVGALMFAPSPIKRSLLVTIASIALAAMIAYLMRMHWPSLRPAQLNWGIQWIPHSARAAFPSMHVTLAFALAQGLLLAPAIRHMDHGRAVIAAAWLCAVCISWSRLSLGVHIPSDVLGGVFVGMAAASIVAFAVNYLLVNVRGKSSSYSSRPAHP